MQYLLTGWWRFSDRRLIRLTSRLLCRCGLHCWLRHDGRPVNCLVCGKVGHPLAYRQIRDRIKALEGDGNGG